MKMFEDSYVDYDALRKQALARKKVKAGLKAEEVRNKMEPDKYVKALEQLLIEANNTSVDDMPRLKFKADVLTTLLKKCMPDLRSLEIKETDNNRKTLVIDLIGGHREVSTDENSTNS